MAKGTWNVMVTLGLGALGLTGRTLEAGDRGAPVVVLHLTDHAGMRGDDLVLVRSETERVFGAMGVRTVWPDAGAGSTGLSCAGVNLLVGLLSPEMIQRRANEGASESTLGTAYKAAGRAYVFTERVSALGARTRMDERVLLGRVIAHEVGHLLLSEAGHSRSGIMAAAISADPTKLRAQFTEEQARAIRAALEVGAEDSQDEGTCGAEQIKDSRI
jgi:hypothetical protein